MTSISTDQDRIAWRQKYIRYISSKSRDTGDELRELVRVTSLTWHKAHQEGLEDAVALIMMLAEQRAGEERELLTTVADAVEGLRQKNDDDMLRIYGLEPYRQPSEP
jgi:hypothetical protein